MGALFPCDLGDGIEVVHDVEVIEIEMECDLGDDAQDSAPYDKIELRFEAADTLRFAPYLPADLADEPSMPFVTVVDSVLPETVPYPRIG